MLEWLGANVGTIITLLIVAAIVIAVIAVMRNDRKKGRSSCGSGCANCPMSGSCHSTKKPDR